MNRLTGDDAKTLSFTEYRRDDKTGEITADLIGGLAKRWFDATTVTVKSKTAAMYVYSTKMRAKHFGSLTVRSITLREIEKWSAKRNTEVSARTFNAGLEVLLRVLDYAGKHGMMLDNPAREIERRQLSHEKIIIPTKDQFRKLLETMRHNNGKDSIDLVEFLAYSGCRLTEVVGDPDHGKDRLAWGDINLEQRTSPSPAKAVATRTRPAPCRCFRHWNACY